MAAKDMNNIMLRIHLKNGKIYDFTNALISVKWSGDIRSPSRTLEVRYIQGVMDRYIPRLDVIIDSTCCFYVDNEEIFRGNCVDVVRNSDSNSIDVVFKDIGNMLNIDKKAYNFKETTACDIAKKIFKDNKPQIKYEKLAPAGTKITKMFIGVTGYDIIMSAYTAHSKADKGHKKYMVVADLDKINVVEKGIKELSFQFSEANNIMEAEYKESLDSFCNRVLIVDNKGNKIAEKVDNDLMKIYNVYVTEVLTQSEKKPISKDEVKNVLHGTDKTVSLTGIGDITCRTGMKVNVIDRFTNLNGIFYIDKDSHEWVEGHYNIKLELNFENIMDEKSSGTDEEKNDTGGIVGDFTQPWNGITIEMIKKELEKTKLKGYAAFVLKCAHAYNFNPIIMINIWKVESYPDIHSVLAVKYNNFGGMTWSSKNKYPKVWIKDRYYVNPPTIEAGIEENFRLIGVSYLYKRGLKSLNKIMGIYSPSYENDTSGYIRTLKTRYQQLTGKIWNDNDLGNGVASEEIAKQKMASIEQQSSSTDFSSNLQKRICQIANEIGPHTVYQWGGRGTGSRYNTDCSGFVSRVLYEAGVPEKNAIRGATTSGLMRHGKTINPSQAKAGDVVICDSKYSGSGRHTFLLMGNGMCWNNGGPDGHKAKYQKPYWGANATVKRYW